MFTIPTIKMNNQSNNRDPLLDELDERIREGNIIFTPDEEFLKRVSENNNKENVCLLYTSPSPRDPL